MRSTLTLLALAALAAAACEGGNGVIGIDDTGVVEGIAFADRDGSGSVTEADRPVQGAIAALVLEATGDTIARATTRADGSFTLSEIPVGRYLLVALRGSVADTLGLEQVVDPQVSVAARDTTFRFIRFGYPTATANAVASLPIGRRVVVSGIALNSWNTFGDSTVHIQDATGAVRAVRMQPSPLQAGDSVRVLGTVGTAAGRVVLADASAIVAAAARGLPPITLVSTAAAASASGLIPNGQARVTGALVRDTTVVAGNLILGVDDGSGRLEVVLDGNIAFNTAAYVPGATFSGAGVLVPSGTGAWQLKPRNATESVITFASITIAAARARPEGAQVLVQGLALNGWVTYGDSTVSVQDATGSIRAVRVAATTVAAGDSVRVIGVIGTRAGQPVITNAIATVVRAAVGLPAPDSVATGTAATAAGGARDAGLVRVAGLIVGSESLANGNVILGVNDGSGRVDVEFDRDIQFNPGAYVPGAMMNAVGVLVPSSPGVWRVHPRRAADASATFQTVSIAQARALAPGRTVFVQGVALNGSVTFTNGDVFMQDPTAAIRVVQLPSGAGVIAGDSIRVLGTVSVQRGQPVLIGNSSAVLLTGVGIPRPDSVSTEVAARANGGVLDARQVAVSGTISAVDTVNTDIVLTIDDGSGPLRVVLDSKAGFSTGNYTIGRRIRARGVLMPNAAGTAWELKPRTLSDLAITG